MIDETVARLNIAHYRKLLTRERDEAKRQVIVRLLAEEEEKLAVLKIAGKGTDPRPGS